MLDLNFCVRVGVKTLVLKTKEKCVRLRACALLYEKGKKKECLVSNAYLHGFGDVTFALMPQMVLKN